MGFGEIWRLGRFRKRVTHDLFLAGRCKGSIYGFETSAWKWSGYVGVSIVRSTGSKCKLPREQV